MTPKILVPRREFLKVASVAALAAGLERRSAAPAQSAAPLEAKADYTLRIATGLAELAPDHIVSTTLYNGQFPGPLLRFKEGQRVTVDVHNDTDTPELVHWHGQMIPSDVDGASEEGTPFIPAHAMQRMVFVPKPSGFRFYHSHTLAGGDLNRGTYTGQAGAVFIEPRNNPGAYDRHSFELTQIAGKTTAGVMKDVVMLGGFQELSIDFTADNPGPTLFHCHQQLHMDFGFMALFKYA